MWYLNDKPIGKTIILNDRRIINPTDEEYRAAGCEWRDPPVYVPPEPPPEVVERQQRYEREFAEVCDKFRTVCRELGEFLGIEDFHGGYEELEAYMNRPELQTPEGALLKDKLILYDRYCNHAADKLDLPVSEWFRRCWENAEQDDLVDGEESGDVSDGEDENGEENSSN